MGEHTKMSSVEAMDRGYDVPFGCHSGYEVDGKFIPAEVYNRRMKGDNVVPTLGEIRVGYSFNPTQNIHVEYTKILAASRIDALEASRTKGSSEKNRTISRAQTHIEDACMLSVKSIFQ
jgi:hypothetical protein